MRNPLKARQWRNPPQSAIRSSEMQNRFRRSCLELRGPRSGLKLGPRSSRGMRFAPILAQIPNLPT
eukprot:10731568-Alexandrium_andersonii.AAC.1